MKSILFPLDEYDEPQDIWGHELESLFLKLPQNDRELIEELVTSSNPSETSFKDRLKRSSKAFEHLRYAYEEESSSLDVFFLLNMSKILRALAKKHIDESAK